MADNKTQRPDSDKKAVDENTKSVDTKATETSQAPNSNKASDAAQGNKGTEDVNAPGINQKSTPGMDSDASSSTSLGTTTAAPTPNESVSESAARTNRETEDRIDTTAGNSPDANHSFRGYNEGGNDYYAEGSEGYARGKSAYDKLERFAKSITPGTPPDHILFGIGGEKFTVEDLLHVTRTARGE